MQPDTRQWRRSRAIGCLTIASRELSRHTHGPIGTRACAGAAIHPVSRKPSFRL